MGSLPVGTLRFWGVWFGRPYDNWHTITSAEATNEEILQVTFGEGESLSVWHPLHWSFSKSEFLIRSASRVLWQWHLYGKPKTPENLRQYDLVKTERSINFRSYFPHLVKEFDDVIEPAVQMY